MALSAALRHALRGTEESAISADAVLAKIAHRLLEAAHMRPAILEAVITAELPVPVSDNAPKWSRRDWIGSLDLNSIVADQLFAPLRNHQNHANASELAFMKDLGRLADRDAILSLLSGPLLGDIADAVLAGARNLSSSRPQTGAELHDKFVSEGGSFTLSYGSLSNFFSGLEGLIGPPSPFLLETMRKEHCKSADSNTEFHAGNHGTHF